MMIIALCLPMTCKKKQVSQENTSDKDKSMFKHSENALEPKKKRKKKDNVTLLAAVKHQGTIGLREINSMLVCHHCGTKKFEFESPTFCCDNGKIRLAATTIPHELFLLFTDTQSQKSEDFRKRIRVYNSIFSFTSFGVKMDTNLASSRRGIYTFRVLGQVFHTLPPLSPREGKPSHFQLYFWDSCNELTNRMGVFDNADICEDTMKLLIDVMKKNPYAELLHRINDFPSIKDVTLQICKNAGVDQRCYNNPTADQVAAIWVERNNPDIPYDRDIILHGTD
ncbi:uncharacterized protein [Primulina eburnea]|uniref:uncharacterized protein isoform X3 n=1 Tax=Primulina eburnea TaxID=1245227 RepID=UPI003C6C4E0F